jgi:hypothetical protein
LACGSADGRAATPSCAVGAPTPVRPPADATAASDRRQRDTPRDAGATADDAGAADDAASG